jgi:hypothetical protein
MKANASNPTNNTRKAAPGLRPQRHGASRPCDGTCQRPTPSQRPTALPRDATAPSAESTDSTSTAETEHASTPPTSA